MKKHIVLFIALSLAGCTSIRSAFSMTKSTDHFIELDENPAIKFEPIEEGWKRFVNAIKQRDRLTRLQ